MRKVHNVVETEKRGMWLQYTIPELEYPLAVGRQVKHLCDPPTKICIFFAISVYCSFAYALTVKYTLGSSNYQSSSSHGNSSTNMGNERGELLWDRERERIKKKEKEKEIAAKMAVRFILNPFSCPWSAK